MSITSWQPAMASLGSRRDVTVTSMVRHRRGLGRYAGAALLALGITALAFPQTAAADSTDDFPIPHRIIATTCTAEQILAAARDFAPVYYQRYMIDYNNHPEFQQATQDKAHWFFSLTPAERRDYSEHFYDSVDPLWWGWRNHMKIFFNNKGVVAKETENCSGYPAGDQSVWNWT